jgi:hypothetical protein
VEAVAEEGGRVVRHARRNPDALCDVAAGCLRWSADGSTARVLRLRLGELAVRAAAQAVEAAPSDYRPWLWLARCQAAVGLGGCARVCMTRVGYLAPPAVRARVLRGWRESREASVRAARAEGPCSLAQAAGAAGPSEQ